MSAERLLRELAPRIVAAVARRFGDFAAAEDAAQEALLAAHVEWAKVGIPDNPGGWLYRVACRRMADQLEGESARRRREVAHTEARDSWESPPADDGAADSGAASSGAADLGAPDDTLLLLFLCCHPSLTPPSAIALTLRAVGGLTTAEIARAFLVPEATMAQRISRAKETIRDSKIPFAMPGAAERAERLGSVLHVLYLIFNEGYVSSSGPGLLRVELSGEAIRLTRELQRAEHDDARVGGLLALFLLTDARRAARTGPRGELIPLHEQDRQLWDRAAIAEGTALLEGTLGRGAVDSYQVQAAIAALHDEAPSLEATDWPQILALYELLRRIANNPMVELNRAIAEAMVHGPAKGLESLAALEASGRLDTNHRLEAVRAHFLEMSGDRAGAIRLYRAAAERTTSRAERDYLMAKAQRLEE